MKFENHLQISTTTGPTPSLNEGMHSFDQYLMQLVKSEYVTLETAKHYAVNWNRVDMESHGFAPATSGILKPDPEM